MAIVTNAFKTYESIGNREDLSDIIKNVAPVDTLFYSSLSEGGADAKKVDWQTDTLAAAGANAQLEGDSEAAASVTPSVLLSNYTQIQRKVFTISGTQEKIKKAGRVSEKDYQTAKFSKELAKDVEYAFLQGTAAEGDAGNARGMRGIEKWIVTNASVGSGGSINSTTGVLTGGTDRSFTKAIMDAMLATVFDAGGNPSVAYMTSTLKQAVSAWAGMGNYRWTIENNKLETSVDVYVSDFGSIAIKPHRGMIAKTVLLIDPAHKGKKGTLRNTHREELAKTGDATVTVVRVEHTLRDLAPLAHGRITNLIP